MRRRAADRNRLHSVPTSGGADLEEHIRPARAPAQFDRLIGSEQKGRERAIRANQLGRLDRDRLRIGYGSG